MESFALANLGEVNQQAGNLQEALANFSDSLEIEWERNEHTELADRLNVIGSVYSQLGRYADATVYLEQARLHIEIANDPASRGYNLLVTAQIHRAKGKYDAAIEAFLSSIPLLRETGELLEVASVNEQLAAILRPAGTGRGCTRCNGAKPGHKRSASRPGWPSRIEDSPSALSSRDGPDLGRRGCCQEGGRPTCGARGRPCSHSAASGERSDSTRAGCAR